MTPIWDKSEAMDVSAYDSTPYKQPLARFSRMMLDNGRSGLTPEHVGRQAALYFLPLPESISSRPRRSAHKLLAPAVPS